MYLISLDTSRCQVIQVIREYVYMNCSNLLTVNPCISLAAQQFISPLPSDLILEEFITNFNCEEASACGCPGMLPGVNV